MAPSRASDVIIISIPFPAVADLPKDLLQDVPPDVPIIDTGNYYPGMRDPQIPEVDAGMPESVWVSQQLGRPVIKAFNNIMSIRWPRTAAPKARPIARPSPWRATTPGPSGSPWTW